MCRKIIHLQNEIYRKDIAFFTYEFDAIIILPVEVSGKNEKDYSKDIQKNAWLGILLILPMSSSQSRRIGSSYYYLKQSLYL